MSCYRFIEAQREHYPARLLCQVLDVPASGYCAWHQAQQQVIESETPTWETALVKVFNWYKRRYGTRRLQVALRQKGHLQSTGAIAAPRLVRTLAQGLHPAHHRFHPRTALCPQPAAQPAQADPSESGLGQ